jgi:hypothetical protein
MSYYTLLGAIAVPATAKDPLAYADPDAFQIRGSSRSGAFHMACSRLLERFSGYESLRCLSADPQAAQTQGDSQTALTFLDHEAVAAMLAELESLLRVLPGAVAVLANEVLPYHGSLSEAHVAAALKGAIECRELNQEPAQSEDGDSPEFFFSALVSLRALLRSALAASQNVVVYSWLPASRAA